VERPALEEIMKTVLAVSAATALVLGLAGCGGDGGSTSPTSASASGAAMLAVSQTSTGLLDVSSSPEHLVELDLPVSFSNGREVPCSLNYIRLQIFDASDVEVERSEVTADAIVSLAGTNRVIQGSPLQVTLAFPFNTLEISRAALTVNGTDDNGNEINYLLARIDVEPTPELVEMMETL
jgi:hypothetical protein